MSNLQLNLKNLTHLGFELRTFWLQVHIFDHLLVISKNGFSKHCSETNCASDVKITAQSEKIWLTLPIKPYLIRLKGFYFIEKVW